MSDEEIIRLFLARDENAIRQTDAVYGKRLFRLADNILKNAPDAEESVNDTYLHTWNSIPPRRPRYFFAYIAKLCRNIALNRLDWNNAAKRKAEIIQLTSELEACIPDSVRSREFEVEELGRILDRFLRALSDENRLIFLRRYWFGDSIAEIAAQSGLREGAVLMRLNRAKDKLSTFLQKEGIGI